MTLAWKLSARLAHYCPFFVSGSNLVSILSKSASALVASEVVTLDKRARVAIPRRIAKAVHWLQAASFALAVCDTRGIIRLLPWDENEAVLREKENEFLSADAYEALQSMDDRFRKFKVLSDFRVTLGLRDAAHLEIPLVPGALLHVFRERETIELVSTAARFKLLADGAHLFAGLPG